MNIKKIEGLFPYGYDNISGSDKWIYQKTETMDFYDVNIRAMLNQPLLGSEIIFISYPEGKVYRPFARKEKIYYDSPMFYDGSIYFLKLDYDARLVSIIKYQPEVDLVEEIFSIEIDNLNLYNLSLDKFPINLTSRQNELKVYYPEEITIPMEANESFLFRDGDKFYFSAWVEEGLNPNGSLSDNYNYYEEVIIKDREGKILSKEKSFINEMPNGEIWIW